MTYLDEAQVEIVTVDYFRELEYEYIHGPSIAPERDAPERADHGQVMLPGRLRDTLRPKLLSGELKVPVAEKMAEEVTE